MIDAECLRSSRRLGRVRYDLIDLRLFLHVVAEGSITAGARRMHLSLPSASGRVRAFEHHAGVPLLIRGRRGVRPTPAGSALARHAREVLAHTARMESADRAVLSNLKR